MDEIAFTSVTLTYGKLFLFDGTFTRDLPAYGFRIKNVDISTMTLSDANNVFIDLTGSFAEIKVNNIRLD